MYFYCCHLIVDLIVLSWANFFEKYWRCQSLKYLFNVALLIIFEFFILFIDLFIDFSLIDCTGCFTFYDH